MAWVASFSPDRTADNRQSGASAHLFVQIVTVFVAYYIAGKLGQATTSIRSSNLGPVWPAYGIALASFLMYGYRVWPGIALSAFVVAAQGSVSPFAAAGQAAGATIAAMSGTFLLRRFDDFDPALSRLRDALGFIVFGALGSSLISSTIGICSLYTAGIQPYSGIGSAWLIYWLGDSTGVLLITPLVFTLPSLMRNGASRRTVELASLLTLLTAACFVVFGDLPLIPIRLHALAFAVLPFVMWGAINFGIGGAAVSVFFIATIATVLTALGSGPFAGNTPSVNAVLLDVLFAVLAVTGLALAAVIAERERAEAEREQLIREQTAMEARLRLAAIVESSDDAILSQDLNGVILSWNAAAHRIFEFTEAEAIGQPMTILIPADLRGVHVKNLDRLSVGERIVHFQTVLLTKSAKQVHVSVTISPLRDASGRLVGAAQIVRDISEQKRAEEALSSVNRRLIEAQEQERTRIARELHDDIGQRLALLTTQLTGIAAGAQRQASEIAADVQALSHELHSSKIELLSIATNMRLFCRDFAERQKATVDFETRNLPEKVPPNISLCLFRVLQEALHNSSKHSGVRQHAVALWGANGEVHLTVTDQGAGFDVASSRLGRGIGLVSMEERLKLVDGFLSIKSQPRRGTTVHARVPVSVAQALPV